MKLGTRVIVTRTWEDIDFRTHVTSHITSIKGNKLTVANFPDIFTLKKSGKIVSKVCPNSKRTVTKAPKFGDYRVGDRVRDLVSNNVGMVMVIDTKVVVSFREKDLFIPVEYNLDGSRGDGFTSRFILKKLRKV